MSNPKYIYFRRCVHLTIASISFFPPFWFIHHCMPSTPIANTQLAPTIKELLSAC